MTDKLHISVSPIQFSGIQTFGIFKVFNADEEEEASLPHFRGATTADSPYVTMHPSDYSLWETVAKSEPKPLSELELYTVDLVMHENLIALRDNNPEESYPIYTYGHAYNMKECPIYLVNKEFNLKCKTPSSAM